MENIFVEFLPPWVETGLQPAFYDKESGTVLQQTARMYARVNMLIRMFNKLSKNTKEEVEQFEKSTTDTVNDYIQRFNELYTYVHDYFDNLDVQEEINNKLDEMLDDGVLQEIIQQFIQSSAMWMFDTVADMKLATNFIDGSYAETLGYYSINDLGGAVYKIRTKTEADTADEMTLIDVYDNTLIAELVKTDTMNVKQFGAKGDGIVDDTTSIQTALNNCNNIFVPSGTYMVNAITCINLNSGNKLELDNDAVIKAITNDANSYSVLLVDDCEDVEICGGTIEGDRETHTGETGEWGHCIRLWGTSNHIYIHDINLINAWGDGIDCDITGSAVTSRVHVNNARRNGYSITKADSFTSNDDIIENTHGTSPQCGVDVEPNNASDILRNITFNNLYTKNNSAYGIILALIGGNDDDNYTNIVINNLRSENDNRGIGLTPKAGRLGEIHVNEPVIIGCVATQGILIDTQSEMPIRITHPIVKYYHASALSDSGIQVQGSIPQSATACGNVDIINPVVTNPIMPEGSEVNPTWAITVRADVTNVHIIDPIDLGGRLIRLRLKEGNIIQDTFKITKQDRNGNETISADNMRLYLTSSTYTANHSVTMRGDQTFPVGTKFNFINTGDYRMEVKFPDNYIYPISSTTGTSVYLNDKGSSMTIERIASDAWSITNQNGNITNS